MSGHHPYLHAERKPDHPALVMADTGEVLTYRELDDASNRFAHLMRSHGLKPGDRIGLMMLNSPAFAVAYWGATRCGLVATLISTHLRPGEAAYIINDSGSQVLVFSGGLGEAPAALAANSAGLVPCVKAIYDTRDEAVAGALPLNRALTSLPSTPVTDQISGFHMLYSSGTTGKPKGIVADFTPGPIERFNEGHVPEFDVEPLVSLNVGPLYHIAPLWTMLLTHRLGGTFVTQRKFDAEGVLRAIERWKVRVAQFVPTMFVRFLALSDEVRLKYDVSSLSTVIHAAAPCPIEIKRRMIEWVGPIIQEYYASAEGIGSTAISAEEWMRKPGSVGRSTSGPIHICDDDGHELATGEAGMIWFEAPPGRSVRYFNDPEKSKNAAHPAKGNWFTVGDVGRLDEDGYLYLTDRKDFMIISGGVNIYPQAVEDCLIIHPKVLDAAVIGVANPEYGEEVKAIVQPKDWADAGPELEVELRQWVSERISRTTWPRSYEFIAELPRIPSGKLAKHELRKRYGSSIAIT